MNIKLHPITKNKILSPFSFFRCSYDLTLYICLLCMSVFALIFLCLYIAADEGEIKMSTKQTKNGKI